MHSNSLVKRLWKFGSVSMESEDITKRVEIYLKNKNIRTELEEKVRIDIVLFSVHVRLSQCNSDLVSSFTPR